MRRRTPTTAAAILALATILPHASAAPERDEHMRHPGYVNGLEFAEMADADGRLIEVNITGRLLKLLTGRAMRRHDENLAEILDGLVSVQAVIAQVEDDRVTEARHELDEIREDLEEADWERFVRVREDGEEYTAFIRITDGKDKDDPDDDEVDGLTVIGFTGDNELMFVNIAGRIDLERIVLLSEKFGLPSLEDLPSPDDLEKQRKQSTKSAAAIGGGR